MATYEKTEYTVLDTSAITLSVLNNLVTTDWGAHVFSRFMEEAVEIHELMDAGQFTSLKTDLTTTSQLETALRMLSPILILPLESTLMDDVLFDYSYSDFYTAMLAYYGSTTAYGNALQSGCKSALITHLVGTYYNSNNFVRTLFTNNNTLAQAVWYHFETGGYPGAAGAAAFLKATVVPVTDLYNYIGTTFDDPSVNIVTEFTAVLGTSVLGTAIRSFMSLKPCTRTVQGDLTMFGILDLYDRTELWDQMIANSSVSSLADMMIDHAPGKFVQAAIELNPTRANTLFSGLDPMNTYHVTDYLNAILNYTAFGSSYYQDIVNQLMTLGYVTDGWNYSVSEHHIYGSSRVGVHKTEKEMRTRFDQGNILVTLDDVEYTTLYRGKRHYELSNHLGNVQVVISDKRISICDDVEVESFKADVLAAMDYYPFGMMMPDRQWYADSDSSIAVNGFNGMRKDDEISGVGNSLDFGARIYDSRLGRWLSLDPLSYSYPSYSPFGFAINSPIFFYDYDGRVIVKSEKFGKKYDAAFKIFSNTAMATSLLGKFASAGQGDYSGEKDGILSRHILNFDTKAGNAHGLTTLEINVDAKWVQYNPEKHAEKVTKETQFKVNVNVDAGVFVDDGFATAILNHEAFLWVEGHANALTRLETGEITLDEFKNQLKILQSQEYIINKYKDIYNESSSLQQAHDQVLAQLQSELIDDPKTKEEEDNNNRINALIADFKDSIELEKITHKRYDK